MRACIGRSPTYLSSRSYLNALLLITDGVFAAGWPLSCFSTFISLKLPSCRVLWDIAICNSPSVLVTARCWFQSYLSSRTQYVHRGLNKSSIAYLICGMLQVSVPGSIVFFLYTIHLFRVIDSCWLSPHMYDDDAQTYGFCWLTAATALTANITDCVEAAMSWMRSNWLQPNPDKTEFLWCLTVRQQHQLPTSPLLIDGCSSPVSLRPLHLRQMWLVDADARSVFRATMLRFAMSNLLLCIIGHTSDASGRTGALTAGLWKWHAMWPPAKTFLQRNVDIFLQRQISLSFSV